MSTMPHSVATAIELPPRAATGPSGFGISAMAASSPDSLDTLTAWSTSTSARMDRASFRPVETERPGCGKFLTQQSDRLRLRHAQRNRGPSSLTVEQATSPFQVFNRIGLRRLQSKRGSSRVCLRVVGSCCATRRTAAWFLDSTMAFVHSCFPTDQATSRRER